MTVFFGIGASGWNLADPTGIIFYIMWMTHYVHRSWVWPARAHISGKKMPIGIVLFAIGFNSINSWLNAEWIFSLHHPYPYEWLYSPQFIIGVMLFITGMGINIKTDDMLFALRENGEVDYKIPHGHMFKWISCPNYFGEILEWIGWALATWSLAGLSFAVWAIANLVPRARANHKWYQEKFSDYPRSRKALIPKIW
jgi:steroid 5-alpha reductase family enzyme